MEVSMFFTQSDEDLHNNYHTLTHTHANAHVHTHTHTHTHTLAQDIRLLDKEMRAWEAFTGLDLTVKNMVTSLRAMGELQNPAVRDRHWQQLMQATQVSCCREL